ncbi:MAG: pyrroline-5-carboxylate reductase [Acutalibacteraceae bacterium]|jgi:pyrroline-5-carboxylate reductase
MYSAKFGFIGSGNMGGSLATAVCRAVGSKEVILADKIIVKAQLLAQELNCSYAESTVVAEKAKFIFMGVKPQVMGKALDEIAPILRKRTDRFVIVTMAAGVKMSEFDKMLGAEYPIIRIMPNTPVSKGKGMILYTANERVFMDELTEFAESMKFAGKLDKLDENLIDAAAAISGCGPAYVYMFAEAMADAGVECGLSREKALEYAAQTLSGAAEMLLRSSKHPGVLKDEVCSPAGTTIAGLHVLEDNGFRGTVMSAVKAAYEKTKKL